MDYECRSKRHRVAKLKRARRRDGKRTHIQNNWYNKMKCLYSIDRTT